MRADNHTLILLAEDDEAQREVLVEVLEYEGYRVITAQDPAEVIEQLALGPEVVLLDVGGVTSPGVVLALEDCSRRPAVVLVSADAALPNIARRLAADAYVSKPYELETLLSVIRDLTRKRGRPEGSTPGARDACGAGAS